MMTNGKWSGWWIVPLFLLLNGVATAQSVQYEFFSINDGLSDRRVNDLLVAQDGYLWLGTPNGLNRFDGYNFLTISDKVAGAAGDTLSAGEIGRIHEDASGNLLIVYENNYVFFDLFDPRTFEVTKIELLPSNGVIGYPRAITTDALGRIFVVTVSTDDGTRLYELTDRGFVPVFHQIDHWQTVSPAVHLVAMRNGRFLLYDTQHGMRLYSATGEPLSTVDISPYVTNHEAAESLYPNLYFLQEDLQGRVFFSFYNQEGLFYFSEKNQEPVRFMPFPQGAFYTNVGQDRVGNLLFLQSRPRGDYPYAEGIWGIMADGRIVNYSDFLSPGDYVSCLGGAPFDRTLFLGVDTGLKLIQTRQVNVGVYLYKANLNIDEWGAIMRGMAADTGANVYLMEEIDQLYRLHSGTGVLDTIYLHDEGSGELIDFRCGFELVYDKRGFLWFIGCSNDRTRGRLFRYDLATCNVRTFPYPERFTSLTFGPDSLLYLGAGELESNNEEVLLFDPYQTEFRAPAPDKLRAFSSSQLINYLFWDSRGTLWIGTSGNGLFQYLPVADQLIHHNRLPGRRRFSDSRINVIYEDPQQRIWVGGEGGLFIRQALQGGWEHFTESDGLSDNTIAGIMQDSTGNYWVTTFNGLNSFDYDHTKQFGRYYSNDGFSHDEFNRFSFHVDRYGQLVLGTINGFNVIHPSDLKTNRISPRVQINQISKYGNEKTDLLVGLDGLQELIIEPDENSFTIQFSLPDYTQPSRNRFQAQLMGWDDDVVDLNTQRTLRYNNLPAGDYVLMIRGSDPNGNVNPEPLVLPIVVRSYLYEKIWFQVLVVLLITGLGAYAIQNRLRDKLREERLRTQLSSDLHDEVSGLLAGIKMQSELLQDRTDDEELRIGLNTVGEASTKAMMKMSDVIWSIDSRFDSVGDLLSKMQEHADDVLLPLDIRYSFVAKGLEASQHVPANVRQDLYFIYKEAINNIAKHAQDATEVQIEIGNYGTNFRMRIRDNGKGSNGKPTPPRSRNSQGMSNLRMRAKRLAAQLEVLVDNGYTIHLSMRRFG
jgi:sugar lactone lactonase YvrE